MYIDFVNTSNKCRLLNLAEVARVCGVTRAFVQMIVSGGYRKLEGPKAEIVLNKLRELNCLVEINEAVEQ